MKARLKGSGLPLPPRFRGDLAKPGVTEQDYAKNETGALAAGRQRESRRKMAIGNRGTGFLLVKAAAFPAREPHGRSTVSKMASLLGRLARGKRKRLTPEEISRRTKVLLAGAKAYRARLKKCRRATR